MKKTICFLLLIPFSLVLHAQELIPFYEKKSNLWGYKNENGKIKVQPKYTYAKKMYYQDKYACVNLKGKWGIIDLSGKEMTPIKYDSLSHPDNGFIVTGINKDWGLITVAGKEVLPEKYEKVKTVYISFWTKYNEMNIVAIAKEQSKWAAVNKAGKIVTSKQYDYISEYFQDGYAGVGNGGSWKQQKDELYYSGGKWGIIDLSGKELIPVKYDDAFYLKESFAAVQQNGKWGIIDTSGKQVTSMKYEAVRGIRDFYGRTVYIDTVDAHILALVKSQNKWGAVNELGQEIIPYIYDSIHQIFISSFAIVSSGNKFGYINISGKEVAPVKYDKIVRHSNGIFEVRLNGKWGYLNRRGEEISTIKFDLDYLKGIDPMVNFIPPAFGHGLQAIRFNNKWGFIDTLGREVIPYKYDDATNFYSGWAGVKLNNKWGFVDETGKEIVPAKYDSIFLYGAEEAYVSLGERKGYVDKNAVFKPNKLTWRERFGIREKQIKGYDL